MKRVRQERVPLGNYPKWLGKCVAWYLRRNLPKGTTILLRGRRPNWPKIIRDNVTIRTQGPGFVPVKYAKRVGLYAISTFRYDDGRTEVKRADYIPANPVNMDN